MEAVMRQMLFPLATISMGCVVAMAQQPLANQPATTVQLPTFSQFSINTTVSVPDRGSISLGGNDSGVDRTISRGPIRNRSLSSSRAASGVSVSATIIDHAELDRAVLAEAATRRGATSDPAAGKAAALTSAVARGDFPSTAGRSSSGTPPSSTGALPGSVATIRHEQQAVADLEIEELASYLAKGKQAEAEGKASVARIFYQMVARRDQGPLKQQAMERLAALGPATVKTAQR
jgi:hypothetical protein